DAGPAGERERDPRPLPHALALRLRPLVPRRRQADLLQDLIDAGQAPPGLLAVPTGPGEGLEVPSARQEPVERGLLDQRTGSAKRMVSAPAEHGLPQQFHLATGGEDQPQGPPDRRGLPRRV